MNFLWIFQIIPKKFHPYKLLIISAIDEFNNTILIMMILLKYLDNITYERILDYLHLNFNFEPNIIHTDYEKALGIAIKNNKFLKKNLIHSLVFLFTKMIRGKLSKTSNCKTKLSIKVCEI